MQLKSVVNVKSNIHEIKNKSGKSLYL